LLDVRLMALAVLGIVCSHTGRQADHCGESGSTDRPFAQISRDDLNTEDNPNTKVWSVAFASDSRSIASATISGEVWLKDLATHKSWRLQSGPRASAQSVSFSPDGQVLAVGGASPAVRFWDAKTCAELARIEIAGAVRRIAFSRNGKLLALGQWTNVGSNKVVIAREFLGDRQLSVLEGLAGSVNALAFSLEGTRLAAGYSSGLVQLWDVATGKKKVTLTVHGPNSGLVTALDWSPDGCLLATAASSEATVRLWEANTGEPRGTVPATVTCVNALTFSPDGRVLVMAQSDGSAMLWDISQGREVGTVRAPGKSLWAAAFSGDGRVLATGGGDGMLRFWDLPQALGDNVSSHAD
jgi:WD40 repeat protein